MIERKNKRIARIGIFAVVHDTYYLQFDGLQEKLEGYHQDLVRSLEQHDITLIDYGFASGQQNAAAIAAQMRRDDLDLIFCNMATYATSATFAPVVLGAEQPIILLALQPRAAMDYSQASTRMQLENDNICSVPEFTGVAIRLGRPVADVVIGTLYDDQEAAKEIGRWCDIAKVLHGLRQARIGLMGHVMEAMYDMHTDPTAVSATFGVHVSLLEIEDLMSEFEAVAPELINEKRKLILKEFETPEPQTDPLTAKLTDEHLQQAAIGAAALEALVERHELSGLAYYYEGRADSAQRQVMSSLIAGNTILNAQGVPMCGEFDLKTCIAMLIMDRLDIGGSFAEFHPFDFQEDFILVGHDGPHHMTIADSKPILRSLKKYHGKPGSGASVEFKLREGPITMLGITQTATGNFKFVIGEGISKKGPIPPTGNTNTRAYFAPTTKEFVKAWVMEGPTHHYALGIGHHAATIKKIADILGIEAVIVRGK